MIRASKCAVPALIVCGCVPTHHAFERSAANSSLERSEIQGRGFSHALYLNSAFKSDSDMPVHVYLTGDGRPYVRAGLAAGDPTPRHPVVPKLLALDPDPGMILGRPCYHGYADTPPCSKHLWTHARYSQEIVASMADALTRTLPPGREIMLIGFSGGGTLAMLLARRVPGTVAVATLAGNLDIDAWTDTRDYAPLRESMNPAALAPLPTGVIQLHYAGARDELVPPTLLKRAVKRTGGELFILRDTTHNRGWERHWPAILEELNRRLLRR